MRLPHRFANLLIATAFATTASGAALAHEQPIIDDELRGKIEAATRNLDEKVRHAIQEVREALNDELRVTIDEALQDDDLEREIRAALQEVEITIAEVIEELREFRREHLKDDE